MDSTDGGGSENPLAALGIEWSLEEARAEDERRKAEAAESKARARDVCVCGHARNWHFDQGSPAGAGPGTCQPLASGCQCTGFRKVGRGSNARHYLKKDGLVASIRNALIKGGTFRWDEGQPSCWAAAEDCVGAVGAVYLGPERGYELRCEMHR